jgi:hypothetical protein
MQVLLIHIANSRIRRLKTAATGGHKFIIHHSLTPFFTNKTLRFFSIIGSIQTIVKSQIDLTAAA